PASGPFGPETIPPMSSASIATDAAGAVGFGCATTGALEASATIPHAATVENRICFNPVITMPPSNSGLSPRCRSDLTRNRSVRKHLTSRLEPGTIHGRIAMRVARRKLVHTAALVLLQCSIVVCGAQAQSYPTRAVTMVVPYPAGGPSDTLARVITDRMKA